MAKTTVFFDRDRDIFFVRTEKTVGRVYALPAYGAMPDGEVCDELKADFEAYEKANGEIPEYAFADAWRAVIESVNSKAKTVVRHASANAYSGPEIKQKQTLNR